MVLPVTLQLVLFCGEYSKAVAFLEEGRSIFWTQALRLRTPLDQLRSKDPHLAKEFTDLSRLLELGSQREASWSLSNPSEKRSSTEQEAALYGKCYRDWLSVLEQIRSLDDFHDFLLPTPFERLQKVTVHGTVVILNASDSGCANNDVIEYHALSRSHDAL
jgi:hypothetical protein